GVQLLQPSCFDDGLLFDAVDPASPRHRSARDRRSLASGRLSLLLALEITLSGRAAADQRGAARLDPADQHREPAVGRATHPRRTAQAWIWQRAVKRCQVHGQALWPSKSGMAYVSA